MSDQSTEKDVIWSVGNKPARTCPIHQRPIHPRTLTKYLWVREQRERQHRDHYMPEAGCPLCFPLAPRVHNHRPYRPPCNERHVDGQLRGACLNDDGSDR